MNNTNLTKDQRQDLEKLSQYFDKIEKIAAKNNIDLDVFISEYRDDGYAVYATESVQMVHKASKRRTIFEKAGKEEKAASKASKSN